MTREERKALREANTQRNLAQMADPEWRMIVAQEYAFAAQKARVRYAEILKQRAAMEKRLARKKERSHD